MVGKYKVITLCGSTKFKDDFTREQKRLTLQGNIVLSVGLFGHAGDDEAWGEGAKAMLDDMHKRKIDMSDEIFVINKNGYIGESTRSEIAYALAKGLPVSYMERPQSPAPSPFFEGVDCVSLYVDDLDKGLRFYQNALGLKLLWRTDGSCGLGMPGGVAELVLTLSRNPMVDMKVASVEKDLPRFIQAGGTVEVGPFDIDIGKCAVVSDPWGNRYCVLDMTKGAYTVDERGTVSGVSPQ